MDKVDLENAREELRVICDMGDCDKSVEYLHRLLAERYTAGWDDAMDLVGSKLAEPAPERTRYREDITR